MPPPSLQFLCLQAFSANIIQLKDRLEDLPVDLQRQVANAVVNRIQRPNVEDLEALCGTVWKPAQLSLRGVPMVSVAGMKGLSCFSKSLTKLDFSGCGHWLHSLSFLPCLVNLQCLNLRDCCRLSEDCLHFIQQLPQLRCLDLENVPITDLWASNVIPGMKNLRALNLSKTSVSDSFVEALTYGVRVKSWALEYNSEFLNTDWQSEHGLGHYSVLDIKFLRLQLTKVTDQATKWLTAFQQMKLLDVRSTECSGRALQQVKAKQGLLSLPNSSKILGKTNSILVMVLRGACGCSTLGHQMSIQDWHSPTGLADWENTNIIRFLQEKTLKEEVTID